MKTSNKLLMVSYLFCFVVLPAKCAVFITDFEMNRMIELSAQRPYCHLHLDRGLIHSTLLGTNPMKMRQVPLESVKAIEEVCFEKKQLTGELQGGLGFIYPGTKWCGPGTIAKNESDFGRYAEEDKCCREHDRCPNTLNPGECKRSICNKGAFTRSHCDCDEKFRKCLQSLNTEIANTLGAAFFNVVQVTCFSVRPHCTKFHRNGYNESEADEVCNRWKFQPSPKFKATMKSFT